MADADAPERDPDADAARARAAAAARVGSNDARESVLRSSIAWSLVSIADSLAVVARELVWQRRHGGKGR